MAKFTVRQLNEMLNIFGNIIMYMIPKLTEYVLIFVIPAIYYWLTMFVFRKNVVGESTWCRELIEIPVSLFGYINVTGNLIMNSFTDTSLKRYFSRIDEEQCKASHKNEEAERYKRLFHRDGFTYCDKCRMYQVQKSWHCKKCDVCIVDRDYHCAVLSQCVGRYTKLYYILSCVYVFFSLCYSTYYTIKYDCGKQNFDYDPNHPMLRYIWFFLFILYLGRSAFGCLTKLIAFWLNTALSLLCLIVLIVNLDNALKGVTSYEAKFVKKGQGRVRKYSRFFQLFKETFGVRWYWAILWPFVSSPIPNNNTID